MMEYLDQFTKLSRYAPDDVDTEEKKEKFLEGLHDELQIHLVNLRVDTLEALVVTHGIALAINMVRIWRRVPHRRLRCAQELDLSFGRAACGR